MYFCCIFTLACSRHVSWQHPSELRTWFTTMLCESMSYSARSWISLSVSYSDRNSGMQTHTKVVSSGSLNCSFTRCTILLRSSILEKRPSSPPGPPPNMLSGPSKLPKRPFAPANFSKALSKTCGTGWRLKVEGGAGASAYAWEAERVAKCRRAHLRQRQEPKCVPRRRGVEDHHRVVHLLNLLHDLPEAHGLVYPGDGAGHVVQKVKTLAQAGLPATWSAASHALGARVHLHSKQVLKTIYLLRLAAELLLEGIRQVMRGVGANKQDLVSHLGEQNREATRSRRFPDAALATHEDPLEPVLVKNVLKRRVQRLLERREALCVAVPHGDRSDRLMPH
mmetsp:Transcript_6934/g.23849  ORF Transcript_6934/g.23849 Transcript_6934/m.23849 type:complete len:337 (+) Transcript_6934:228-1238(+)